MLLEPAEPHEDDERSRRRRERVVVEVVARGRVPGDERHLRRDAAVGDRDPDRRGHGAHRRHAGHDLALDPGCGQRERLLAAAAEDERVAALEAHDLEPLPPELDEQVVQLGLADVLARDHERVGGRLVDELGRDEHVVDERVAAADEVEARWR